jgi:hypothetical protein
MGDVGNYLKITRIYRILIIFAVYQDLFILVVFVLYVLSSLILYALIELILDRRMHSSLQLLREW